MFGCKFPWLPNCHKLLKSDHDWQIYSKNKKGARFLKRVDELYCRSEETKDNQEACVTCFAVN